MTGTTSRKRFCRLCTSRTSAEGKRRSPTWAPEENRTSLSNSHMEPISAAEIIARRHPLSERLSPEELAMLHALTKKLAEPSPDASRNQKESNRATF